MTIIKATCPICGDVELTKDEVRFVVSSVADRSFYAFTCPVCLERVTKPAGEQVIKLLTIGGLVPERIDVPAEALEEHLGAPVTWDDVLDFGSFLTDTDDLVAAVLSAARLNA